MPKKRKWKYKGVDDKTSFSDAGSIILKHRCDILKKSINLYLKHNSAENLHEIRIAIRRLRYNMEVFSYCFDKKKFLIFYNIVEQLQDLTGKRRDLDVLLVNLKNLSVISGIEVNEKFFDTVRNEQNMLNDTLKLEFFQYLHGNELKGFVKMLNKKRRL